MSFTLPIDVPRKLLLASLIAYVLCLVLPALRTSGPVYGIELLMFGWFGLLEFEFSWMANMFILMGLYTFLGNNPGRAMAYSAIAVLFMLTFLMRAKTGTGSLPPVTAYLAGFWLWVISALLLFAAGLSSLFTGGIHLDDDEESAES